MENNSPVKNAGKKPHNRKVNNEVTTEAGNPVMFVTIEEHNEKINEKLSQLISLENAFRGCEQKISNLEDAVKDLKGSNNKLRLSLSNETIIAAGYLNKLSKIPTWIKKLFNA
jgi:CRISPR/Cas system CMR-associated protein Cmr5 small subunit